VIFAVSLKVQNQVKNRSRSTIKQFMTITARNSVKTLETHRYELLTSFDRYRLS